MGILRRFREWREDKDGVLTGPDINAGSVSTDELFTSPAGVRLTKTSDQDVANFTVATVSWGTATELNSNADAFADLTNDQITIPNDDYSYARLKGSVFWGSDTDLNFFDFQKNGGLFEGNGQVDEWGISPAGWPIISSAWVSVSSGDSFTLRLRHQEGTTQTILNDGRTWLELEAI